MIERYIYAVVKDLPREIREEASAELRRTISYRVRKIDGDLSEQDKIMQVLTELGPPKKIATQYRGKERYLIGPKYFERYLIVLRVVLISIFIGLTVVHGFSIVFSVNSLSEVIGGYIGSLLSALLQGIAWVTGIFALLEYNDVALDRNEEEKPWTPSQLPPVPKEKARISRSSSVFTIVFITLFLTLFFFSPESIGIYYFIGENMEFIPLFNLHELSLFRILIFISFTVSIVVELMKILKGRWTRTLAMIVTTLNILSALLVIFAILNPDIWNDEITMRIENFLTIPFERILYIVVTVIVLVTAGEAISDLYRGFKYGE